MAPRSRPVRSRCPRSAGIRCTTMDATRGRGAGEGHNLLSISVLRDICVGVPCSATSSARATDRASHPASVRARVGRLRRRWERRQRGASRRGVAAGPRQLAVGEGQLAGLGERDERDGAESEFAAPSADDAPLRQRDPDTSHNLFIIRNLLLPRQPYFPRSFPHRKRESAGPPDPALDQSGSADALSAEAARRRRDALGERGEVCTGRECRRVPTSPRRPSFGEATSLDFRKWINLILRRVDPSTGAAAVFPACRLGSDTSLRPGRAPIVARTSAPWRDPAARRSRSAPGGLARNRSGGSSHSAAELRRS